MKTKKRNVKDGNVARRGRAEKVWQVKRPHYPTIFVVLVAAIALFYGIHRFAAEPGDDENKIIINIPKGGSNDRGTREISLGTEYPIMKALEINSREYKPDRDKEVRLINPPSGPDFYVICAEGEDKGKKVTLAEQDSISSKPYRFKKSRLFHIFIKSPLTRQEKLTFEVTDVKADSTDSRSGSKPVFRGEVLLLLPKPDISPTPLPSISPAPLAPSTNFLDVALDALKVVGTVIILLVLWSYFRLKRNANRNKKGNAQQVNFVTNNISDGEWSQKESRSSIASVIASAWDAVQPIWSSFRSWRSANPTNAPRQTPMDFGIAPSISEPSEPPKRTSLDVESSDFSSGRHEGTRTIDPRQTAKQNEPAGKSETTKTAFNDLKRYVDVQNEGLQGQLDHLRNRVDAFPSRIIAQPSNKASDQQFTDHSQAESPRFDKLIEQQDRRFTVQQETISGLQSDIAKLWKQIEQQGEQHRSLNQALERLKQAADRQPQDDFWPRILGGLLEGIVRGQNLSALIDRTGADLNNVFKEQIPPADVLGDIPDRIADIGAAIGMVAEAASKFNLQAAAKVRTVALKVGNSADTMCRMKEQLKNRQITIPIEIQVSAHKNAGYTFLEEVGRAIKQGIDSVREPQLRGERDLERIIKNDVIEVVDICDLELNSRGGIREIEAALNELFSAARLKQILPARNEPFQAIKHDLIRYMDDPTVGSQSIVEVVRRGFYRLDVDQQQPFRKATVLVNR